MLEALASGDEIESECAEFLGDLNFANADLEGIGVISELSGDIFGDMDPLAQEFDEECSLNALLQFLPSTCPSETLAMAL